MFTTKDFVAKYEDYTDEELIDVHHKMADYSQEELEKRLEEKQILAKYPLYRPGFALLWNNQNIH